MRLKAWLVTLAAGAVVTAAASDGVGKLPDKLAGYRSWKTTTAEPHGVPWALGIACTPPSAFQDLEETYGPHARRWIRVYANPSAASALEKIDLTEFPVGSIIVKEKLVTPSASSAEAVAFMIKHEKKKFPASGGWEFLYYPSAPSVKKADEYDGCVTCHRVGGKRDYVFATFEGDDTEE